MSELDTAIRRFHDALAELPGVVSAESSWRALMVEPDGMSMDPTREWDELPFAALERTGGGLRGETLLTTELRLQADQSGWIALEFLAWWVSAQSRDGRRIQLRPVASVPISFDVQLGRTLRFRIESFALAGGDPHAVLSELVAGCADSLERSRTTYGDALDNPADPSIGFDAAAARELRATAERGDPHAQFELAQRLRLGDGVAPDPVEAFRWYAEAADQGYLPATVFVGFCRTHGIGVEADPRAAVDRYREAAERGLAAAMGMLGQSFEFGRGVEADVVQAIAWYRRGAEAGDARCQIRLAECFERGIGVDVDPAAALHWYRTALEQGHEGARLPVQRLEEAG